MRKWTVDLFDGSRDMLMASSEFWRMPKRIWASLGTCFPTLSTTATTFCHDKIKLQISFFEKARLCQVSTVFLSFLFRCGTPSWVLTSIMNVAFFFQVHQADTCFISFFNTHFQFASIVEVILLWEIKHVFHIFAAPGVFREKVKIQCGTYDTDTCARCNITAAI